MSPEMNWYLLVHLYGKENTWDAFAERLKGYPHGFYELKKRFEQFKKDYKDKLTHGLVIPGGSDDDFIIPDGFDEDFIEDIVDEMCNLIVDLGELFDLFDDDPSPYEYKTELWDMYVDTANFVINGFLSVLDPTFGRDASKSTSRRVSPFTSHPQSVDRLCQTDATVKVYQ